MAIAAIVGPGNIGTDLLAKLRRSSQVDVRYMVGVDPASDGLARARALGVETSAEGVDWLLAQDPLPDLVSEATSARAHVANAPRYAEAGIQAIDLTPAAIGPLVCPAVNLHEHVAAPNLNMITCGAQATIPIVHAVSRVTRVPYAEIVASIASKSAGPGTRANIDEFTETTARGIETVGQARKGKAIIILNPAEPPMIMRDTVFTLSSGATEEEIESSILAMVEKVQAYVPGYRLKQAVQFERFGSNNPVFIPGVGTFEGIKTSVFLEVEGAAHYLPAYAGNLDIMTSAALRVAESIANRAAISAGSHR